MRFNNWIHQGVEENCYSNETTNIYILGKNSNDLDILSASLSNTVVRENFGVKNISDRVVVSEN